MNDPDFNLTMADVPVELRINLKGGYNPHVNYCRECGKAYDETRSAGDWLKPVFQGFAEFRGDVVGVKECQNCFVLGFHHIRTKSYLESILRIQRRNV